MTVAKQGYSEVVFTFWRTAALLVALAFTASHAAQIRFERVPENGIQPQAIVETNRRVHLLFFKGDAMGGDVFYTMRNSEEKEFGSTMKVNQQPGSVLAAGTMRGPQMAIGKYGRAHVVWMGGNGADKVVVGGEKTTPLLYARLSESKRQFETERNILTHIGGLDGGQAIAADQKGSVYVIWHGAPPHVEGEEERGLYVARSTDGGTTFEREEKAKLPKKGSCACCGIRAITDGSDALHVLFRSAEAGVNRPQLWLRSEDQGKSFEIMQEHPWTTATCPASSMGFSVAGNRIAASWETNGRVVGGVYHPKVMEELKTASNGKQKHPRVALNKRGETLLTWVEDVGWGTEGTLAVQLFDVNGRAVGETSKKLKLPAWSFGAPYAQANGDFVVLY
ncbi:MAG TPA: hypothetical protein VF773_08575 [Verrucomicrobiae bacterium]